MNDLSIIGLNIDGLSSKLESLKYVEYVNKFDIVVLCELKCDYPFSIAGFKCIRSSSIPGEELRGGVAVLFKHHVWDKVYKVKKIQGSSVVQFIMCEIFPVRCGIYCPK